MSITTALLERAFAALVTPAQGNIKTAASRWLDDRQLTKLCQACRNRKKK